MVLVDTSVWISLYRKRRTRTGESMWRLVASGEAAVCGQIWVEFVGGFRRAPERAVMAAGLASFPFVETTRRAFERAGDLAAAHPALGAGDAIIAATAIDSGIPLFTLDGDFRPLVAEGLALV